MVLRREWASSSLYTNIYQAAQYCFQMPDTISPFCRSEKSFLCIFIIPLLVLRDSLRHSDCVNCLRKYFDAAGWNWILFRRQNHKFSTSHAPRALGAPPMPLKRKFSCKCWFYLLFWHMFALTSTAYSLTVNVLAVNDMTSKDVYGSKLRIS